VTDNEKLIEEAAMAILARSWGLGTMEAARADAEIALSVFHTAHSLASEPPSRDAWRDSIVDERCQQPSKGYTSDHDREHGLDHLLEWAQEYARIGEPLKSAALIEAARDLHRASEVPESSADDTAHRLSLFLDEVTGSRLSKSTYDVSTMIQATDERYARLRDEAVAEALSDAAAQFGVSPQQISKAVRGLGWAHIPADARPECACHDTKEETQ
jgi:hypothetical protein